MYTFTSPQKRTSLDILVISSLAVGVVLLALPTMLHAVLIGSPAERWVALACRVAGVLGLAAGIYLTVRYSLRMYRYTVEIPDPHMPDERDFVITEFFFNRRTVVARVSLSDIDGSAVTVAHRDTRKALLSAFPRSWRVFHYTGMPFLRDECLIPIPGEESLILIPHDPHMLNLLQHFPT